MGQFVARDVSFPLKLELDHESGSLTEQVARIIRGAIEKGEFRPGDRIPPTRRLAADLGISRGTTVTAVEILIAEGLLESRVGSGVYVSQDAALVYQQEAQGISSNINPRSDFVMHPDIDPPMVATIDFRPCRPSMEHFPRREWKRCLSAAGGSKPHSDYGDPKGHLGLRHAIVSYLRRSRGLNASVDEIIITNGAVHAMHLLSVLYLDSSSEVIVEDPGYPLARQTFELTGARIVPWPVDDNGLIVEDLPTNANNIQFVYVTPSHQFPTGSRLSLGRRHALIDWAQKNRSIIVEDDYDGEFRYDVPPLAPLAAISNHCVVYCGTFSKTMFPGLRIGFAVAPRPLVEKMAAYRAVVEYAPNDITQSALTRFIEDGHFERHTHRMRRMYSAKRQVVANCLKESSLAAEMAGMSSGLHALIKLRPGHNAERLSLAAEKQGLLIPPVSRYLAHQRRNHDNALVLGYAEPEEHALEKGLNIVADLSLD